MEKKVYVVLENWVVDCDFGDSFEVYDTKEKALEDFKERVRNAKIDMQDYDDLIEEEDENYYTNYIEGYYSQNHITIRIEEKGVK